MNNKSIKKSYYILLILICVFIILYTTMDIIYYGGVMKNNLQVYATALIIPMFHSFKSNIYKNRMQKFL